MITSRNPGKPVDPIDPIEPDPGDQTDPADIVDAVVRRVHAAQPYLSPTPAERTDAGTGLGRLILGDTAGATEMLAPLDLSVTEATDPATGRPYALAVSGATERAWGLYLVDRSAPLRLCIAVPHPKSDRDCEQLALRLWRSRPGSILALATVHRDAVDAGRDADQARNPDSVFHHLWTAVVGPRGVPQVQLHGFADDSAPEQIVVSTGAGPVSPAAERIATQIAATGLCVTRSWDGTADPGLRAVTNLQGIAAAREGWVWVHVEHNRTVRADPALWQPAVDAIAAADPAGETDDPACDPADPTSNPTDPAGNPADPAEGPTDPANPRDWPRSPSGRCD